VKKGIVGEAGEKNFKIKRAEEEMKAAEFCRESRTKTWDGAKGSL